MYDNALLLEGGAMRGLYTAGVLDAFMEAGLEFGCVYGVSAGVLNAVNYVARQPGRSANVNYTCINDRRYLSMTNLLHGQSIFNFDYLFNQVPLSIPFDYGRVRCQPSAPDRSGPELPDRRAGFVRKGPLRTVFSTRAPHRALCHWYRA